MIEIKTKLLSVLNPDTGMYETIDTLKGKDGKNPVKGLDYYTDADKAEFSEFIASELAKRGQLTPEYANSIEECTDTSKLYVLPDGFIYAYVMKATSGGADYTNLVPTSIDTDGTIYNGMGYKDGVRIGSDGLISSEAQENSVTTGLIQFTYKYPLIFRMKGAEWLDARTNYGGHYMFGVYTSSKELVATIKTQSWTDYQSSMIVSYDSNTGITKFDFTPSENNTSASVAKAVKNGGYIRLTAYGKGEDLIITVNEEIEESETTIGYAWTNTGHAFIPADYEDRIIVLESQVADNTETIAELEQQVDDILDGNTQIAANTKFDPTVYGLPVLYLTGDTSPIAVSKDNKVTLDYVYGDLSGICTLKGQGATSYKIAQGLGKFGKFNYTINFDTAFESADGWGEQKKYCLKANWIDHSHSRNVVSAKLWGLIVKSRSTENTNLSGLVNGGAVDGFPVVIVLNDEFHGLYTFNIPKDSWMFNLVEDDTKTQAIVGANQHTTATQFKGELAGDESDFELEFASNEDDTDWVTTSLNTLINACINSDGTDLDTIVAQYLDWDSVIDYYIFTVIIKGTDMVDKNYLLSTFDGVKWHFTAYDMDSTYGLNWDGSGLSRAESGITFSSCADTHRAFELVRRFKTDELKARYNTLRNNTLSETRIMQQFENFAWAIPSPVLVEDVKRWPSVKGSSVNTIDQIGRWVRQRLEATDKWIKEL